MPATARANRRAGARRRAGRSAGSRAARSGALPSRDVAQDAADPGRRALERLDRRRVVVALDLEGDGQAVADVDDAGVLAGALEHRRSVRWKALQQQRRVLVAAVLGPEQREDRELEGVRLALQQRADTVGSPSVRPSARWSAGVQFRDRGQREIPTLTTKEDRGPPAAGHFNQDSRRRRAYATAGREPARFRHDPVPLPAHVGSDFAR